MSMTLLQVIVLWLPVAAMLLIPGVRNRITRLSGITILSIWATTRVLLFILGWVSKLMPSPDIILWFETQVPQVLNGQLPYREFLTPYSPLFPYFCTIPHILGLGHLGLNILFILVEGLAIFFWLRLGNRLQLEKTFRYSVMLFILSPYAMIFNTSGQDEMLIVTMYLLAASVALSQRAVLSGIVNSLGFLLTKLHALGSMLSITAAAPNRKIGVWSFISFLFTTMLILGILAMLGVPPLGPLEMDMADEMLGGTIWRLINDLTGFMPGRWSFIVTALATGLVSLLLYLKKQRRNIDLLLAPGLITLTFLITNRTMHPDYLVLVLPFACLWVVWRGGWLGRNLMVLWCLHQAMMAMTMGSKQGWKEDTLRFLVAGDVADYVQLAFLAIWLVYGFWVNFSKVLANDNGSIVTSSHNNAS